MCFADKNFYLFPKTFQFSILVRSPCSRFGVSASIPWFYLNTNKYWNLFLLMILSFLYFHFEYDNVWTFFRIYFLDYARRIFYKSENFEIFERICILHDLRFPEGYISCQIQKYKDGKKYHETTQLWRIFILISLSSGKSDVERGTLIWSHLKQVVTLYFFINFFMYEIHSEFGERTSFRSPFFK